MVNDIARLERKFQDSSPQIRLITRIFLVKTEPSLVECQRQEGVTTTKAQANWKAQVGWMCSNVSIEEGHPNGMKV